MYRVSGPNITYKGQVVHLHGLNVVGMELPVGAILGLWSNRTIPDFLKQIKSMGHNFLRLPICSRTIANVPLDQGQIGVWAGSANSYLAGIKSLDLCDHLIKECEKLGIRYMFDLHNLDSAGKIPDLWYYDNYTEADWINDLVTLARRYKGLPGFVGLDTKNEPGNAATWGDGKPTDWKRANEAAFKAIDAVNSEILINVEWMGTVKGLAYLENNPINIPRDRYFYSVHIYFWAVWSGDGWTGEGFNDPNYPKNMDAIYDRMFGTIAQTRCVMIGEFGGPMLAGSKDAVGQTAFVPYLISRKIFNTAYWGFQHSSGWDTGGVLADDGYVKIRQDKVDLLKRLRTDLATFTTDPVPSPVPSPTPSPTPTPTPVPGKFKQYELVKMRTSDSPIFMIDSILADGSLSLIYWNSSRGEIAKTTAAPYLFSLVVQK